MNSKRALKKAHRNSEIEILNKRYCHVRSLKMLNYVLKLKRLQTPYKNVRGTIQQKPALPSQKIISLN